MSTVNQLANRIREVFLNGKWIANTNFKEQLSQVPFVQASQQVRGLNSIAQLTFHINYYVEGVLQVLLGRKLEIRDKFSFDMPELKTETDWQSQKNKLFTNAEAFAVAVEELSDKKLEAIFEKAEYGTYARNIEAMIEHAYYHLGQIVLIRKCL